jgi:hypothetical protein
MNKRIINFFAVYFAILLMSWIWVPSANAQLQISQTLAQSEVCTTAFGPARADVILTPTNFLACTGTYAGDYALCYYSGTGDLPCILSDDKREATCTCYQESGSYYVSIYGILDPTLYAATIEACGKYGSHCLNLGDQIIAFETGELPQKRSAPVCEAIQAQTIDNNLFSTFSFEGARGQIGQTSCNVGFYAGCMTAPCVGTDDNLARCTCPTFFGPYQVGQDGVTCYLGSGNPANGTYDSYSPGDHVWSAAYLPYQYVTPTPD